MTPRQRIMLRREQARLMLDGRGAEARALEEKSVYEVLDTCATDGLCAVSCPVAIDTGRMVKRLRGERHRASGKAAANRLAARFAFTESAVRAALRLGHAQAALFGHGLLARLTRAGSVAGLPGWSEDIPHPAGPLPATEREGARALYLPACTTRVMGPGPGEPSVARMMVAVSARAGVPVWIPPEVAGTCCGMPFSSKGYVEAYSRCANSTVERLWNWSDGGRLPIVIDTSPCAWTLRTCRDTLDDVNRKRFDELRILDSIEFARDYVLPNLEIRRKIPDAALHPVCSVVKMNLTAALTEVAAACANDVFVPVESGCCGFAGDRGFLIPELTEAATRAEAAEIRTREFYGHYSSSRTCETGMARATGRARRSFWVLLDEASR